MKLSRSQPKAIESVVGKRHNVKRANQDGLTLIELLVAMSIATLLSAMLVMTWFSATKSFSQTSRSSHSGEMARDAVARIGREIRDAEPYEGYPAVQDFDAQNHRYIDFTTTFNQADNDQPLPTPVLTEYVYRIDQTTGEQTLHRLRDTDGDGVLESGERDDLVVQDLKNYAKQGDEWVAVELPFQFMYLDPTTRKPIEATDSTPAKYISLVRVHLLVEVQGRQAKPTDLMTTVELRNQNPY
jgi:prepilin-type N-terminal cleavage/methylation domain-containing protein